MGNKHFKAMVTTFADCDLIDDATEVYGGGDDWPDVEDACEASPSGQHAFDCSLGADPEICIHCKKRA